ncbi:MAG: hypothetical protein BWY31_00948 [Lentisphaerae bacterium ADurb.Bin242]|nr:MAG: hypothetical protein BWY31_00948 [Lentisphaerae bacterium ADurb.Bin242]
MVYLYIALMVVALIGIVWCQKKQKVNPNAQAFAFVFLVLILVGAGGMLYETGIFGGDREMDKIISNEVRYAKARSQVLADYIGKTYPGQKAVIITEANVNQSPISKASLETMTAALTAAGINVSATEALNIPESSPENPVPLEVALTAKVYNDIFNKYKDANLYIIMSQLPFVGTELQKLSCWKNDPQKSRIILVNGEVFNLKGAIASGHIGAAAAMKTGPEAYDPEKTAPKETQAAFDTRYILVTPQNVKEVAEKNKDIFAK